MLTATNDKFSRVPSLALYLGLAGVMLALLIPLVPSWQIFIHMWRVETAASIFLLFALIYIFIHAAELRDKLSISRDEITFVIAPIILFTAWSFLSALWAPSWKSAVHHTLIWSEYLILFLIFRSLVDQGRNYAKLITLFAVVVVLYSLPAILEYCAFLMMGGTTTLGIRFQKFGEQAVTILPLVLVGVVRLRGRAFALGVTAVSALWLLILSGMGRINLVLFGLSFASIFAAAIFSKPNRRYLPKLAFVAIALVIVPIPIHLSTFLSSPTAIPAIGRFTDDAARAGSNDFRKLMISLSGEMIRDNPILGLGADNYGAQVNNYRQAYGAAHPDDKTLALAEDQIPFHAHNEFLQIVAELGLVGGVLIAWLLAGIGLMGFRSIKRLRHGSLYPIAAVVGLGIFLSSSLVSSYSFRVMQNGIIFFFILAVASKTLLKTPRLSEIETPAVRTRQLRYACAVGLIVCVGLLGYSAVRVVSVGITSNANQIMPIDSARPLYDVAMHLDDENPDVRQNLGMRLFRRGRYTEAIPFLDSAIRMGRGTSTDYSYLASAQTLAGDSNSAEETMAAAAQLYPRSPFVLVRYADLLARNGKASESEKAFSKALSINERAANTWNAVIASGPKAVSELAAKDEAYMSVMDLTPSSSIYAVVAERYIKHPEEQRFSLIKVSISEE